MRILLMLFLAMLITAVASGTTVFSSFGPSEGYVFNGGLSISTLGSANDYDQSSAIGFTSLATYVLSEIDLPLGYVSGTNSFTIELLHDNSGPTGSLIEVWNVAAPSLSGPDLIELFPTGTVTLSVGTLYWIAVLPGGADTWGAWNEPSPETVSAELTTSRNGGSTWYPPFTGLADIGVEVLAAPEPASLFLLGVGLLAAYLCSRSRTTTARTSVSRGRFVPGE